MTAQKTIGARGWAGIGALSLIWGGSFLANRLALEEVGVATTVAVRVMGGALALWALNLGRGLPVPRDPRMWGAFLLMGVANNVIPFSLIVWGQRSIESGLAAILNASTAIFGVLVAALAFRDERLTARKAMGVAVGFGGVVVVTGPEALRAFDATSLAQLAILGASLSYACAALLGRVLTLGVEPEVAGAGMLLGSSLVMVPVALVIDGAPALPWAVPTWGALLYLALACSAGAYLIFFWLLRTVGSGNTSLVTLTIAPVAIGLGALVYGEALELRAYLGFTVLALGLAILDGRVGRRRTIGAPAQ